MYVILFEKHILSSERFLLRYIHQYLQLSEQWIQCCYNINGSLIINKNFVAKSEIVMSDLDYLGFSKNH